MVTGNYASGKNICVAGTSGEPELQRPPGRRERAGRAGRRQPQPRLRGRGRGGRGRGPRLEAAAAAGAGRGRGRGRGSAGLQGEAGPRHLLLQTLPTLPHPTAVQLLRSVTDDQVKKCQEQAELAGITCS